MKRILAPNESIYGAVQHRDAPPTALDGKASAMLFPKLRGRGAPVLLPPQRQRPRPTEVAAALTAAGGAGGGGGGRGGGAAQAGDSLDRAPAPRLTLPAVPTARAATGRDLRLTSAIQEVRYGPKGPAMKLQPPPLGTPRERISASPIRTSVPKPP